ERALAICEELQDIAERSVVLNELARYHRVCGNLNKAESLALESLELLQKTGDLFSQGRVMYQLSRIYEDGKDYHKALAIGEESTAIFDSLQNVYHGALLREHVGDLYVALGRPADAQAVWLAGQEMSRSLQYENLQQSFSRRLSKLATEQAS
ncbi:MAG: tetratricopeptide repeat protein, partial [Anaerolineales bacterium]|nr:tetratricopeptide repeat protein [Anaerolineales bacterium]